MNRITIAFLLTIISGLSTLLGLLLIIFKVKNENKIILRSLAFSSGVMLSVSLTDLIPEGMNLLRNYFNGLLTCTISFSLILLGILLSNKISKIISLKQHSNNLYKIGIISMISIILHNIPEGIATFISSTKYISLGISLTIAIALHNIPEGISISIPIYYSTKSKKKAFSYTLISALSEPLGALITYLFLINLINNFILGLLFIIIAGIMINISTIELLPSSLNYNTKKKNILFFIIGIIAMLIKFIITS